MARSSLAARSSSPSSRTSSPRRGRGRGARRRRRRWHASRAMSTSACGRLDQRSCAGSVDRRAGRKTRRRPRRGPGHTEAVQDGRGRLWRRSWAGSGQIGLVRAAGSSGTVGTGKGSDADSFQERPPMKIRDVMSKDVQVARPDRHPAGRGRPHGGRGFRLHPRGRRRHAGRHIDRPRHRRACRGQGWRRRVAGVGGHDAPRSRPFWTAPI